MKKWCQKNEGLVGKKDFEASELDLEGLFWGSFMYFEWCAGIMPTFKIVETDLTEG